MLKKLPNPERITQSTIPLDNPTIRLGYLHAGFCLTALPHRDPKVGRWIRRNGNMSLIVQSGVESNGTEIGIPFGSYARAVLVYLQTQAIRTRSPEIELGRTLNDWMRRLNLPIGGKSYTLVLEQTRRIAACSLSFIYENDNGQLRHNAHIISLHHNQRAIGAANDWLETVTLSDAFYEALSQHPVPIDEDALRYLHASSIAFDVYVWLSYRLHAIDKPTPVSWAALLTQFSQSRNIRSFRQKFARPLKLALEAYKDACVEVTEQGLVLYPSPSPVAAANKHQLALPFEIVQKGFPSGAINYAEPWANIARCYGGGWDINLIADAFRQTLEANSGRSYGNLQDRFQLFCKKWTERRGKII